MPMRRFRSPHTVFPHAQFLSNGNYVTVVTNAGGGSSFCRGLAVTKSRRDPTRDPGSQFVYLRDVRSGSVWSATYHPTAAEPDDYVVEFRAERATFRRHDDEISTQLDIAVSTEDDVEVRRVTVVNQSTRIREIDVTSYAEIVLASAGRRSRASGLRQAVSRNGVPGRQRGAALPSTPAGSPGTGRVGGARLEPRRPAAGARRMGNRSRTIPRPRSGHRPARPRSTDARCRARRASCSIPSSASASGSGSVPGRRCASRSPRASPRIERRPKRSPRSTATRARPRARSRSPSRTRRAVCAIWAFRTTRRCCSNVSRRGCSSPTARCGRLRTRSRSNELGQAGLWPHGISGDLPILLVRVVGRRRCGARAPGPAGAGVLAPERAERRCRHPERGSLQLSGRDPRAAHGPARQRALADVETPIRRRVPPARRSDRQSGAHADRGRRAGGPRRGPRRPPRPARQTASGPEQPASGVRGRCRLGADRLTGHRPAGRAAVDDVDERPRRVHRRRASLRDRPGGRPGNAAALGERHRERPTSAPSSRRQGRRTPGRRTAARTG